jgi:PKD repeat protein
MSARHLLFSVALLAATLTLGAATYNGGRSDGLMTLGAGDYVRFVRGDNPVPKYLWILVQEGGGSAMLQGSDGTLTQTFYLNAYDMILLDARDWIDLYFRGSYCQIYYGGAIQNPPAQPICNTGSIGPVLLLTDEVRNVAVQSAASGPPGLQVSIYQTVTQTSNGNMPYRLLSNLGLWGTYQTTACSGHSCCDPQSITFFVKNNSGGAFTPYILDSQGMALFDWNMVPAPPIACDASASPTSGTVPVAVSFIASATGGSGTLTFDWAFGDGKAGTGQSVSHTYKAGGKFTWKLVVTDQAGKSCQKTGTLSFLSPLTVSATVAPRQGPAPLTVSFSCIPKGGKTPYQYQWEFGDGATSTLLSPSHTYAETGEYQALVTVTDAEDHSAAATVPVYCGIPIAPSIASVQKLTDPLRLSIVGTDFEVGCQVLIDGTAVATTQYKKSTKVVAKDPNLKNLLPKGVPKCIRVQNPSGGLSECYWFTR